MREARALKTATWRQSAMAKLLVVEQVEVERRRDAERVVVSGLQQGCRLDQVHAYQQAAAVGPGALLPNAGQEG